MGLYGLLRMEEPWELHVIEYETTYYSALELFGGINNTGNWNYCPTLSEKIIVDDLKRPNKMLLLLLLFL